MALDITQYKNAIEKVKHATGISAKDSGSLVPKTVKSGAISLRRGCYVLVDTSGSMRGEKIEAAKNSMRDLITEEISVVRFATNVELVQSVQDLYNITASGSTAMLKALNFAYSHNPTSILLITDGKPTDSNPDTIIREAVSRGVPIHCIILPGDVDVDFLRELCLGTGGSEPCKVDDLKLLEHEVKNMLRIEYKENGNNGVIML